MIKKILIIFFTFFFSNAKSQKVFNVDYIGIGYGIQMSGIKPQDFVISNYSPIVDLTIGNEIGRNINIEIGYEGNYFKTIANDVKHYYSFYKGALSFAPNKSPQHKFITRFILGYGLLDNHFYRRPSFLASVGASVTYKITNSTSFGLKVNSRIGWDIYQNDEDILNSCVVFITRKIKPITVY
jgi:hypothetical protein